LKETESFLKYRNDIWSWSCAKQQRLELDRGHRCTIIFSIHQPRYSIFELFDCILLLSSGRCSYHGRSEDLLPYFSSIGFSLKENENPGDFLLDIVQGVRQPLGETLFVDKETLVQYLYDKYHKSIIYAKIKQQLDEVDNHSSRIETANNHKLLLPEKSCLKEFYYLSQRALRNAFRNPLSMATQTILTALIAILTGCTFSNTDRTGVIDSEYRSQAIFFVLLSIFFGQLSAVELLVKRKILFNHERESGYYRVSTYFISELACDLITVRLIPLVLYSLVVYFMIGFQRIASKFFIFFVTLFLTNLCATALCTCIAASINEFGTANILVCLGIEIIMIFCDFIVETSSITPLLSWMCPLSAFRYAYHNLHINEFTGLKLCLPNSMQKCLFRGEIILQRL
ncbi:unnamed protein product, partial [Didymodactylos carnosus]